MNERYDKNNNEIYKELKSGGWVKRKYNDKRLCIYEEDNDGNWVKFKYNSNDKLICIEFSNGKIHIINRKEHYNQHIRKQKIKRVLNENKKRKNFYSKNYY